MNCRLVLIEWEDSRQPAPAWQHLGDFSPQGVCKCTSVGFLIHDGVDQKVLAPNVADIEDEKNIQVSGITHIPTSAVKRIVNVVYEIE